MCKNECYKIGGPWITFDPHCPVHNGENDKRDDEIRSILIRIWNREISADDGVDLIQDIRHNY